MSVQFLSEGHLAAATEALNGNDDFVASIANIEMGIQFQVSDPATQLRLFGKPSIAGRRRLGVALARGEDVDLARAKARAAAGRVEIQF